MNGEPGENDGFLAVEDPQSSDTTARRHRIATAINLVVVIEMEEEGEAAESSVQRHRSAAAPGKQGSWLEKSWTRRQGGI